MTKRCTIDRLPEDQRAEIDAEIIRRGFEDFEGLARWALAQGFEKKLSRSGLHRYSQRLRARTRAEEEMQAVLQELGAIDLRRAELHEILRSAIAARAASGTKS